MQRTQIRMFAFLMAAVACPAAEAQGPPPIPPASQPATSAPTTIPTRCRDGMKSTEKTAGRCCWPGQSWSKKYNRCDGPPQCPPGWVGNGGECVRATQPATPPPVPPVAPPPVPPAATTPPPVPRTPTPPAVPPPIPQAPPTANPPPTAIAQSSKGPDSRFFIAAGVGAFVLFDSSRAGPLGEAELGVVKRNYRASLVLKTYGGDNASFFVGGRFEAGPRWGNIRLSFGLDVGPMFVVGAGDALDLVLVNLHPASLVLHWRFMAFQLHAFSLDIYIRPGESVGVFVGSSHGVSVGIHL